MVEVLRSQGRLSGKQVLPRAQAFIQQGSTDGSCLSVSRTLGWLPACLQKGCGVILRSVSPAQTILWADRGGCAHHHAALLHHSCVASLSVSVSPRPAIGTALSEGSQNRPALNHVCLIWKWKVSPNGCACSAAFGTAVCWDARLAVPCASNLVFILRGSALTTAAWRISSGDWINYRPMTLPDYWAEQCVENLKAPLNVIVVLKIGCFLSFSHLVFLICCSLALIMVPWIHSLYPLNFQPGISAAALHD